MFNTYNIGAMINISSVLLYQNTGSFEYLYLALAFIAWSTLMHVLGVAFLISPEVEVEIDDDEYAVVSDYTNRGALQVTVFFIAYALYLEGYAFFAGAIALQALVVLTSCLVSTWVQVKVKGK